VFATLTVAELPPPELPLAVFAVAVDVPPPPLPQPAATSATSGTANAAERRPRGLRVMLAPLLGERTEV
jgi:hypothetical protein